MILTGAARHRRRLTVRGSVDPVIAHGAAASGALLDNARAHFELFLVGGVVGHRHSRL